MRTDKIKTKKANPFISGDGYLSLEEFTALAREIDKFAIEENLKPADIYHFGKSVPKYDQAKSKKDPVMFERKRAIPVKIKKRMPAAGSLTKMVVLLRLYKDLEGSGFDKDIATALSAIDTHNKLTEKTVTATKKVAAKKREGDAKAFDKNLEVVEALMLKAGLKASSLALGQSMMGKTMIVKLPNGGYISIGKADEEKFKKAKEPKAQPARSAPERNGQKAVALAVETGRKKRQPTAEPVLVTGRSKREQKEQASTGRKRR